jgi:hypothetical protein
MMLAELCSSALFRRIRRSRFVHEYVRPIYARADASVVGRGAVGGSRIG